MEKQPLISVIVPVYKVERYLPRCIESILRQTYTNFELILVDDGTPDRSGIICDRYAEKDSRIIVIHKENGGVSTARNAGIDVAKGEWITFIDSDDWVTNDYLNVLLEPLSANDYDLIIGLLELRSVRIKSSRSERGEIIFNNMNELNLLETVNKMELCGPCHKLFLKDIIRRFNLCFPEGIAIAEDTIFVNEYLMYCKKIYSTGKIVYYYNRSNELSVTKKYPYFEDRGKWDKRYIDSYVKMLSSFSLSEKAIKTVVINKTLDMFCSNIRTMICSFCEDEAKRKIKESLNYYCKFSVQDDACVLKSQNEKHRGIIRYMREHNVDAIYDSLNYKTKSRLKVKIKATVKRVVRPFIEKYRDGLVKFKF